MKKEKTPNAMRHSYRIQKHSGERWCNQVVSILRRFNRRFIAVISFTCLFLFCTNAQNLVLNPGFEQTSRYLAPKHCSFASEARVINQVLEDWSTFISLTPDLVVWDSSIIDCPFGPPHSGTNAVGLIVYHPGKDIGFRNDYHEFIQGELRSNLIPGKSYEIAFWIQQSDSAAVRHIHAIYGNSAPVNPLSANNLGIMFSEYSLAQEDRFQDSICLRTWKAQVEIKDIVKTRQGQWQQITLNFIPDRPYRYFLIGNFHSDNETLVSPEKYQNKVDRSAYKGPAILRTTKRIAYYLLDDIYVGNPRQEDISEFLTVNKNYTFKHVNFDTGSSVLLPAAFHELDQLSAWLMENANAYLEIEGHTDDIGEESANQVLSALRAKAVYDYLIEKGVCEKRLTWRGYGESRPVADNKSTLGRSLNRRVECSLIEN